MIFLSLILFLPILWFLPWWCASLVSLAIGYFWVQSLQSQIRFALGCGLSWGALAFVRDGSSFGLISLKMSDLLSLPHRSLIFLGMMGLGFVLSFLWVRSGALLSVRHR